MVELFLMEFTFCQRVLSVIFCFLLLSFALVNMVVVQDVLCLEICKVMLQVGESGRIVVEIYLVMDLVGFNLQKSIDFAMIWLEIFADDLGIDFLVQYKIRKCENEERGHLLEDPVFFVGVGDWQNDKDIKLVISVIDMPAVGAKELRLTGEVVLNFVAEGEASSVFVEGVLVAMGYGGCGFDSFIGVLMIEDAGGG